MPASQATADRIRPAPRELGPETTTAQLIEGARRRESAAWEELMARYGGMVRGVVASFRQQDADAADAVVFSLRARAAERELTRTRCRCSRCR